MPENYLIIGDDEYLREKEIARIRDKALRPHEIDLNFSVYSPQEVIPVIDALGTTPFISDKRVVLVRNAGSLDDKGAAAILSYLDKPLETSILILTADQDLRKTSLYGKFSKKMTELVADRPKEAAVRQWIRSFFEKEKIGISEEAVDLIVELKGQDTLGVKTELEKLALYSSGKQIEVSDVEELVGRSMTETVFGLVGAIDSRNADKVFLVLSDLRDQKKQPVEVIGYLAWHLKNMQKVSLIASKGKREDEIAKELGFPEWRAKRLIAEARKYSHARVEKWLTLLLEADRDIKTGLKDPDLALEMLVVGLMKA